MPLYTYNCHDCDHSQEEMHAPSDRLSIACPSCTSLLQWQFPTPNLHTDTTFFANRPKQQERGSGYYSSQLGEVIYGRSDVKKICEERGWGAEGCVEVKKPPVIPDNTPYSPAKDVVDREVDSIIYTENDGHATQQQVDDLTESVTERLSGSRK